MTDSSVRAATSVVPAIKRLRLTRFRVMALAVMGVLGLLAGISIWRLRSLGDLPDFGDPFDVKLARRPVLLADEDNAFQAYANARSSGGIHPRNSGQRKMPATMF